jgi:peptidoglycan/LPS O-acetylase OafA/YrhL
LDGWRGISILCVLAAHLLPLGPKAWQLNATAGPMGMALFFTLSGFLITHFLLNHAGVLDFLIRRFFRIVPLALAHLSTFHYEQRWIAFSKRLSARLRTTPLAAPSN